VSVSTNSDGATLQTQSDRPGASTAGSLGLGDLVGERYVVTELLGQGGQGAVYKAIDIGLERPIALKVMHARGRGCASSSRERLLAEGQAIARLSHPNVVSVFYVGEHRGDVFVAMEYVDGGTLRDWVRRDKPALGDLLDAVVGAGRGLAAAHEHGLVHRDFKPDNVLVGADGRVRVVDFGLATRAETDASASGAGDSTAGAGPGTGAGTPGYMAPEQMRGDVATAASDQFALAVTAVELLAGKRPFEGTDTATAAVERGAPAMASGIPGWLRPTLARALRNSPEDRFASVGDLLDAIERGRRGRRRWFRGAALGGLLGVAVLVGASLVGAPTPCAGELDAFDSAWGESQRRRLAGAFAGAGPVVEDALSRTTEQLDRYRARWLSMRAETCRATRVEGAQSAEMLDRRMRCLDRRRDSVRALSEALIQGGEGATGAVDAAYNLPRVSDCADVDRMSLAVPEPGAPEVRRVLEQASAARAEARALARLGQPKRSRESLLESLRLAESAGHQPEVARTLIALGQQRAEELEGVETSERALQAAMAARDPALAADAWIAVLWSYVNAERLDEVLHLEPAVETALSFLREPGDRRSQLDGVIASALKKQGNYKAAMERARRELEAQRAQLGEAHPRTIAAMQRVGSLHRALGDVNAALRVDREAATVSAALYGPRHPNTGDRRYAISLDLDMLGKTAEARAEIEEVLQIYLDAFGPTHLRVAAAYQNLASLVDLEGDYERALELNRKCLAIRQALLPAGHSAIAEAHGNVGSLLMAVGKLPEATVAIQLSLTMREENLGANHPSLVYPLNNLGSLAEDRKDWAEAAQYYGRAVAVATAAHGDKYVMLGYPLTGLGTSLRELGRTKEALQTLERALEVRGDLPAGSALRAHSRFELAKTAWVAGRRGAALEGASKARSEASASDPALVTDIDAWLSRRGKGARARDSE